MATTKYAVGTLGVNFTEVVAGTGTSSDEGDQFELGQIVCAHDGTEYVRCHAAGAIDQYSLVAVDENWEAVEATKALVDDGYILGVAQIAVADNEFFWLARKGQDLSILAKNGCLPDASVFTSATAGAVDDSLTSQTELAGVTLIATQSGGSPAASAACRINTYIHVANP